MANTVKVGITATDEGFKSTMDQMKQSANSFGNSLDSAGKKSQTLNGAFRAARKEASDLALAYHQLDETAKNSDFGKQMKAQLDQALQAAGQLADIKGDVAAEIKNIASDTMAWDATAQGIGIVSSGLQGLASAYGLLGGDVKAFTQALTAVNAVQSVANTIIGIGNALQKQSALMVGLRAAKTALFGSTQAAATVAETANTTATAANTTATVANTAAKGANTTAAVGQTAATTAATTAQLANNAAVLANPYVLAAAAVVALTVAIVAWCTASDKATEAQEGLAEATTAANDATKKGYEDYMKTRMEMDRLIKTVNNFNGTKEEEAKLVKELNSKYGDALGKYKSLNDWKNALATTTLYYCRVMQAEAKYAALSAAAYEAYANALAGEDYTKNMAKYNSLKEAADAALDDVMFYQKMLKIAQSNAGAIVDSGSSKSSKSGKSNTKSTKDEKTELEKLDEQIKNHEKELASLNKTQDKNIDNINKLKSTIASLRTQKLAYIDTSSLSGLEEYKKELYEIRKLYDENSDGYKNVNKQIDAINSQILDSIETMMKSNDIEILSNAQSSLNNLIKSIDVTSESFNRAGKDARELKNKIEDINQIRNNSLNNIMQGSIAWLEQDLEKAKRRLDEWLNNNSAKFALTLDEEEEKEALQQAVKDAEAALGNARVMMKAHLEPDNIEDIEGIGSSLNIRPIDLTFEYKKTPLEKLDHRIDYVKNKIELLKDIKLEDVGEEIFNQAQQNLKKFKEELKELEKQHKFTELTEDIKEYSKEVRSASLDTTKGFVDGMHTIYNVITDLPERLDECKDGFEGFFEIMDAGFSLIDSITSFIENIQKLSEVINLLSGAKEALASANVVQAQSTQQETVAEQQNTAATLSSAAADATAATASMTKAGANTAEASTEAAAQNSKLGPWGWIVGIAAALAVAGALFGILGQAKGFASGGIIQGKTTMGDQILARVNAGEMVLNKKQQANLFNMLDNGRTDNSSNIQSVSTVKVRGEDIILAIKNYSKIHGNSNLTNILR